MCFTISRSRKIVAARSPDFFGSSAFLIPIFALPFALAALVVAAERPTQSQDRAAGPGVHDHRPHGGNAFQSLR